MVKLTYIQQQVSNVGQKYDNEVSDPTLVNIRGRIETTLGNRYLSWASRMRMFNEEKNNMFRVLRRGRENGTLTCLEAEAAAKYLTDIDSVLLDYSYLKNGVANKETVDLRTQISVNRTSRINNHYLSRREAEITSQRLEQTVQSDATLPLDTTLPRVHQNVGGVETEPVSYRIADLFRRAGSAVADRVKSVEHYEPVQCDLPHKYLRLAGKVIPTLVVTAVVGVASLVGGLMWGNSRKANLARDIRAVKQPYSTRTVEQNKENEILIGEMEALKQQYAGLMQQHNTLAEKTEQYTALLTASNETNQALQQQIQELILQDRGLQGTNVQLEAEREKATANETTRPKEPIQSETPTIIEELASMDANWLKPRPVGYGVDPDRITLSPSQFFLTGNFEPQDYNAQPTKKHKAPKLNGGRVYPLTLKGCWSMKGRSALVDGRRSDEEWTPGVEVLYGVGAVPVGLYEGFIGEPVRGLGNTLGGNKGPGIILKAPEWVIGSGLHLMFATPAHIGEWLVPRKDNSRPNKPNIPVVSRLVPNYRTDKVRYPIDPNQPSQYYNVDSTHSLLGNACHGASTALRTWGWIEIGECLLGDDGGGAKHAVVQGEKPPGPHPGEGSIIPGPHAGSSLPAIHQGTESAANIPLELLIHGGM